LTNSPRNVVSKAKFAPPRLRYDAAVTGFSV
jgi:hypothetical protein